MVTQTVYETVRNGVCAVGYLTEPLTIYRQNLDKPIFEVVGTGFLVKEEIVLTNRHVIGALMEARITYGIPDTQFFIQFVVPSKSPTVQILPKIQIAVPQGSTILQIVPRMIREVSYLDEPKLDLGFIKYRTVNQEHFASIHPLNVAVKHTLQPTQPVGVCGYPYGTSMLVRGLYQRWGPVVQQGYISAISPFDTTSTPDEILLDVRTAGGMSGAPIFVPEDGTVVAVHYAGIEATTAFGIPITQASLNQALSLYEKNRIVLVPEE